MQQLLQQLDPDFYRETRLHIARVELEQLRRERSAFADIERRSKISLGHPDRAML
jgi:DNA replication initiation complex subunit (GINS family)